MAKRSKSYRNAAAKIVEGVQYSPTRGSAPRGAEKFRIMKFDSTV